jgi:hypothetical protein
VRRFHEGELWRAAESLDLCRTFFALLETLPTTTDLTAVGRHLQRQAGGTHDDFEAVVRAGNRALTERLCIGARAYADAQSELPAWWRDDLLAIATALSARWRPRDRSGCWTPGPSMPLLLGECPRPGEGLRCALRGLAALFRAAREREAGHRDSSPSRPMAAVRGEAPSMEPRLGSSDEGSVSGQSQTSPLRCSPYQTWLWRLHRLDPSDNSYVIVRRLRGTGALRADLLEAALQSVAERHEALRCRLPAGPDDEPLLEVRPAPELVLERMRPLGPRLANEPSRPSVYARSIWWAACPCMRFWCRRPKSWTVLSSGSPCTTWPSTVFAEDIFWRELDVAYANLVHGRSPAAGLRPLAAAFGAIAQRQREALAAADPEAMGRYWHAQLEGAPELRISWRTPAVVDGSGVLSRSFEVPSAVSEGPGRAGAGSCARA